MNKTDLVLEVASRTGLDKHDVGRMVNAVLDTVREEIAGGGRVTLAGFGTFERRQRAARVGRNPHTGAAVAIRATARPTFRPGKEFRTVVAKKRRKTTGARRRRVSRS
jgi:DNA-binding protein HU-beta